MKAIGKNVLIEQKFEKLKEASNIILPETAKKEDDLYNYKVTLTLLQKGKECAEEAKVNDIVHLKNYATPSKIINLEGSYKDDSKIIINHAIYEYDAIVGVE